MRNRFIASVATVALSFTIALPAFAVPVYTGSSFDATCVSGFVNTRETALSSAFATFTATMNSAYSKRGSDLATAWAITEAASRKKAVKTTWDAFKKSSKDARSAWMKSKKAAWSTFKPAAKTCNGGAEAVTSEAATGESLE